MLNLTASMAVATEHLARRVAAEGHARLPRRGRRGSRWRLRRRLGAGARARRRRRRLRITESGGLDMDARPAPRSSSPSARKASMWRRLRVHGTPAHGSMPFGADNALVKAAEVVRRIATYRPAAEINDVWRAYAAALDLDAETRAALVDPARVCEACETIPTPGTAKFAHACTHTTFSPDVVHGGTKTNVIPDEVVLEIDIRTLPGQTDDDVDRMLADALGDWRPTSPSSTCTTGRVPRAPPTRRSWHAIERSRSKVGPEATLMPRDHRRRHRRRASSAMPAASAYGFGLLSAPTSPTRSSAPASTATTSASTSSRCGSPRSAGSRSSKTSSGEGCSVKPSGRSPVDASSSRGRASRRETSSSGWSCSAHSPSRCP